MAQTLDMQVSEMTTSKWLGLTAIFTLPALITLALLVTMTPPSSDWTAWLAGGMRSQTLIHELLRWYIWIPLAFWVMSWGRRWPLLTAGKINLRHFALHGALSLAVSVVCKVFDFAAANLLFDFDISTLLSQPNALRHWILSWGQTGVYWIVLIASLAWRFYRQAHEQQLQLAQARMATLKAQLHPHFLFNTLNSVSALMEDDITAARQTNERLIDLLHASLAEPPGNVVTLDEELNLTRHYLEIEHVRFADRLDVRFDISPESLPAAVPHLLLQPLVENAVRHGIGGRSKASLVRVASAIEKDQLRIEIDDDGPGITNKAPDGIGLSNTRARLEQLYGPAASLDLEARPEGGCRCTVRLPLRHLEKHL